MLVNKESQEHGANRFDETSHQSLSRSGRKTRAMKEDAVEILFYFSVTQSSAQPIKDERAYKINIYDYISKK